MGLCHKKTENVFGLFHLPLFGYHLVKTITTSICRSTHCSKYCQCLYLKRKCKLLTVILSIMLTVVSKECCWFSNVSVFKALPLITSLMPLGVQQLLSFKLVWKKDFNLSYLRCTTVVLLAISILSIRKYCLIIHGGTWEWYRQHLKVEQNVKVKHHQEESPSTSCTCQTQPSTAYCWVSLVKYTSLLAHLSLHPLLTQSCTSPQSSDVIPSSLHPSPIPSGF